MQMPGNPEINENQPEFIPEKPSNGEKTFTLTELSHYNGKDGMPAYVAYRNVVYDLTNLPRWIFGRHFGLVAGRDLTIQYDACHVGRPTLDRVPVVGRLVPDFPEIE